MIDANDISGHVDMLHTKTIEKIIWRLVLEKTMFEAASPETFEWFVRRYEFEGHLWNFDVPPNEGWKEDDFFPGDYGGKRRQKYIEHPIT